jgi:hypothetical protein
MEDISVLPPLAVETVDYGSSVDDMPTTTTEQNTADLEVGQVYWLKLPQKTLIVRVRRAYSPNNMSYYLFRRLKKMKSISRFVIIKKQKKFCYTYSVFMISIFLILLFVLHLYI